MAVGDRVEDLFAEALPELARRAGRDRVAALVRAAAAFPGRDRALGLARQLVKLGRERSRVRAEAEVDAQVLRAAAAAGAGHEALADALERYGEPSGRRGDLAALRRHLDQGAIDDRMALRIHGVDQSWEMLAITVAHAAPQVDDDGLYGELVRGAAAVASARGAPWHVRVAAVGLLAWLGSDLERGVEARQCLLHLSQRSDEDAFVFSEALAAYLDCPHRRRAARPLLEAVWRNLETAPSDHLFARARVVRLAARHGAFDLVCRVLETDESEHVRIAAARALVASGDPADRGRLRRLMVQEGHATPKLTIAAGLELLDRCELDPQGTVGLLAHALGAESAPGPSYVLLEAAWSRLRAGELGETVRGEICRTWPEALVAWSGQAGRRRDAVRLAEVVCAWSRQVSQDVAAAAWEVLAAWVPETPEGASRVFDRGPVAELAVDDLLDLLFVLAQDEVDLSARPLGSSTAVDEGDCVPPGGYEIFVGLRPVVTPWRVRYEVAHPRHDKRQGYAHTVDYLPPGPLVAWSARMSEVVATAVPGQRVSSPVELDWDEHLPLPANLLVAAAHGGVRLRTLDGVVRIHPPPRRASAAANEIYVQLADLRGRLKGAHATDALPAYDGAVFDAGFDIERQPRRSVAATVSPWLGWLQYVSVSDVHASTELGIASAGALAYWTGTKLAREAAVRSHRRAVPFVVGGWGSRGKSSVERIKSALFHGLGYTVLCKSTGCEAMLLLAIPGQGAVEVFLYRPNDKATIVEQQNVLAIAAGMKPQVVLWECMALNPVYTGILQGEWMRDDMTTITNTYPDHEDIQGPAGRDVADVISNFTPRGGTLVSSEQHMTPVLARRARKRRSRFESVRPEHWSLVPDDVLARFPYAAHPRNVSLVTRLAGLLGVPADVAWRTMADRVLPDLGAFKSYGPIEVEGRRTSFINGCSANDRASFLSNWERKDLSAYDERSGLAEQLVVVVNNRADRPARQAMFAQIVALDVAADRIAIIGSNVGPMSEAIREALQALLRPRLLDLAAGKGGRAELARLLSTRLRRPALDEQTRTAARAHATSPEVVEGWTEEVRWMHRLATTDDWEVACEVDRFIEVFVGRILPLHDPKLTGDQVLYDIVRALPDGVEATLLGTANIKGTGLDFVYRWVSIHQVVTWLASLEGGARPAMLEALTGLSRHAGYGLADGRCALDVVEAGLEGGDLRAFGLEEPAEEARTHLRAVVAARSARLDERDSGGPTAFDQVRKLIKSVDLVSPMLRRRAAERLYVDLAARRVGALRAADIAKDLVAGEKG